MFPLNLSMHLFLAAASASSAGASAHGENKARCETLVPMRLQNGSTFLAYGEPDLSNFYRNGERGNKGRRLEVSKTTDAVFMNLTPNPYNLDWIPGDGMERIEITNQEPFTRVVVSLTADLDLCYSKPHDGTCRRNFETFVGKSVYIFDPFRFYSPLYALASDSEYFGLDTLLPDEIYAYYPISKMVEFSEHYRHVTGRDYVADEIRARPLHHMWNSDYYDQEYIVDTRDGRCLVLKAVAPGIFEIENFLSDQEAGKIIEQAIAKSHESESSDSTAVSVFLDSREANEVFQRAADAFKLDDSLLAYTGAERLKVESPSMVNTEVSTEKSVLPTEAPQRIDESHFHKFASLLIFLSDDTEGSVVFPNWVGVSVSIQKGKAVLVYNMLPDGNVDMFSRYEIMSSRARGRQWTATIDVSDKIVSQ